MAFLITCKLDDSMFQNVFTPMQERSMCTFHQNQKYTITAKILKQKNVHIDPLCMGVAMWPRDEAYVFEFHYLY